MIHETLAALATSAQGEGVTIQLITGTKPAISPAVGLDPATYENFAIQNDNLVFFFGQGAIVPESAGALTVPIPRGPVDRMIA